ncbi:MAG: hypothetical protein COY40_05415 [Alphaproteobacteria bacterium CG_4_10_14_0_8_um_filter_53_9]|nr:MAG: hypothetical protein COY40_05415 [Alphaproteobacteria bacterium CG_4_10_14_0_8_um_filter_53_9]
MTDTLKKTDPLTGMMQARRAEDVKNLSEPEIEAMMRELAELRQIVAAQRLHMEDMEDVAAADPMTGLANHRALEEELAKSISTAKRYGRTHALIALEVDNFDGYQALDAELAGEILRFVAGVLRQNIRPTDIASRLENGQFAVILNELRVVENANMRAKELARCLAATPCVGKTRTVQLSAHVACVGFGADDDVGSVLERMREVPPLTLGK